jgi:hypothetical protein
MAASFRHFVYCMWRSFIASSEYSHLAAGGIRAESKLQNLPAFGIQKRQTGRKTEGPFHNREGLFQIYEGSLKMLVLRGGIRRSISPTARIQRREFRG